MIDRPRESVEDSDVEQPQKADVGSSPSSNEYGPKPEYIVAIGGSAGGFEAFESFFVDIPPDTGMAFVVIQHLDPNHESLLSELLQRTTAMSVREVSDETYVEANTVYVIAQNTELSIHDGHLHVTKLSTPRGVRLPVDLFFESLAAEQKDKSIGIIVSGMGTDGTLGLRAIKEASGLIMVQNPDTAKFDGMPRSAINTGLVDYVAKIDEIPKKLIDYVKHASLLRPKEDEVKKVSKGELQTILQLLRTHTKHDFTLYKKSTLYRRIAKRAGLLQVEGISEYASYVETHPEELDSLFREFLIGVTRFFRDPEAFDYLESSVLPELVNACPENSAIRVWVPGCSTGEEAYSLAIVLREVIDRLRPNSGLKIQVFATDIDDRAIAVARKSLYPTNIATDISPERLNAFFVEVESGYIVAPIIREAVVFAPHDLLIDPPFTKMDIVSCRNMMIYFGAELQKKVLPILYYALNLEGILFLGTAESTAATPNLFSPIDNKWKVYRRRDTTPPARRLVDVSAYQSPVEKPSLERLGTDTVPAVSEVVKRVLLERYAPPSVTVDVEGKIIHISGRTGKYLEPAEGALNWNICAMAREGLKLELPTALYKAARLKTDVLLNELNIKTNGDYEKVNVTVSPFTHPDAMNGLLLVIFEDVLVSDTPAIANPEDSELAGATDTRLAQAEIELLHTKEHLQSIVEEMETTQEELKSSNEELQSTNEELQSTNEELITSKEELQSLNEELVTVNNELQTRVDDLTSLNNDMSNLMNSTQVATIFLDLNLLVRRFTPAVVGLFKLRSVDIGRPITDITQSLRDETIEDDLHAVLDSMNVLERQVESRDGRWFIMRIMPYRTLEGRIDGVIATFSDVTALKQLEWALRKREALGQSLNEISAEISASLDNEPVLPIIVKKASEALGVGAGMIAVRTDDRWMVRQTFGLQELHQGMPLMEEDIPYMEFVEKAGEPVAIRDVDADNRVSCSIAKAYGMRSVIGVALVAGGGFVGVLSLFFKSGPTIFTEAEIDFVQKLGIAVSLALNNIHLYDTAHQRKIEAEEARQRLFDDHNLLQEALLPVEMHATLGYSLATRFIPGAAGKYVGGDFYDVFETEDGKTALLIGDVTGKGVEAASLAVAVRSTIRAFAYDIGRPAEALTHANAVTYTQSLFSERFATVFLAIIEPETGQFSYASAGHPPSMVLSADGRVELLDTGRLPIGIEGLTVYNSMDSQLSSGDRLVMYTDGISESHRGATMYGEEGIKATLEQCGNCTPEEILDRLFVSATQISLDKLADDAAVVIIGCDTEAK